MKAPHKAKRCIVHVGLAKTGTTTVQDFLFANRRAILRRHGILYPTKYANHFHFQTAFSDAPSSLIQVRRMGITDDARAREFGASFLSAFEKEFRRIRPEELLISSEYFSSMHSSELVRLGDYLRSLCEDLAVLIYLRDPWTLAVSAVQQRLKDGLSAGRIVFRYTGFLRLFGKFEKELSARITARPYIGAGATRTDIIADFCEAVGIGSDGMQQPSQEANQSVGYTTMSLLSALNSLDPCIDSDRKFIVDDVRDVYRTYVINNRADLTRCVLSPDVVRSISTQIAPEFSAIGERFPEIARSFREVERHLLVAGGSHSEVNLGIPDREELLGVLVSALRALSEEVLWLRRGRWSDE